MKQAVAQASSLSFSSHKQAGSLCYSFASLITFKEPHFHTQRQARVSYLAKEFNLTKPTISDAVRSLAQKSLIHKIVDEKDSRSYSIELTALGKETTQQLATK